VHISAGLPPGRNTTVMIALLLVAPLVVPLPVAAGSGQVELVILADPHLPITAQQQWGQRLAAAGIRNFRIRTGSDGDRASIQRRGSSTSPRYLVTALLTARNQLVVPGARFTASQMPQLARWLDELAQHGPPSSRPQTGAFGLAPQQLEELQQLLALPVGFSTKGLPRRDAIVRLVERLPMPCRIDAALLDTLSPDDQVAEELQEVSRGTALAYLVRSPGWVLRPRPTAGGVELVVSQAAGTEIWPIGWPVGQPRNQVLPGLYEFLTVNVENVPVARVIDAVSERVGVPVLLDHNALARGGIDPEKQLVSFPHRRTSYAILLRNCLYQAKLKYELRVDEAGKPLLWVTTVKPQ